jgi:tRNA (guanine37-N1)-methyltransferase
MKKTNFVYLSLFPDFFDNYFKFSIAKKAKEKEIFNYRAINIRDFSVRGKADDYPYGGGPGMVLKIEPLLRALGSIEENYPDAYFILLSPQGKKFCQEDVERLLGISNNLVFICGHYEGFDERIIDYVDEQISVGEFVVTGGEIPSLLITDCLIRKIPGVIKRESYENESFSQTKFDFASYTRPEVFDDLRVPGILLSGNHGKILQWRKKNREVKEEFVTKQGRKKINLNK